MQALLHSIRALKDAIVLTLFFLTVFSLIGYQLFCGTFRQKCVQYPPYNEYRYNLPGVILKPIKTWTGEPESASDWSIDSLSNNEPTKSGGLKLYMCADGAKTIPHDVVLNKQITNGLKQHLNMTKLRFYRRVSEDKSISNGSFINGEPKWMYQEKDLGNGEKHYYHPHPGWFNRTFHNKDWVNPFEDFDYCASAPDKYSEFG